MDGLPRIETDGTFMGKRLGEELGRGGENVVYEWGSDEVLKVPNHENGVAKEISDYADSREFAEASVVGDEVLERCFGPYLLKETFIRGVLDDGREVNFRSQRRVVGETVQQLEKTRRMWEVRDLKNPEGKTVREQGFDILCGSCQVFKEVGVPVDISPSNVIFENGTNRLFIFDPGPMEAIKAYFSSVEQPSEVFRQQLMKYYFYAHANLMGRLRSLDEGNRATFQERVGMSVEKFDAELTRAKDNPLAYIREKENQK